MKMLLAHVGKDLRDQRAMLVVLAAFLALLGIVGSATLPESMVKDGGLIPWLLYVGGALGAVALAADFVPSEGARGTLALLTRLPHGLASAFTSKAVLVAGAALAFAAFGALVALLGWRLRFAAPHALAVPEFGLATGVLGILGLGWWVLAMASWMPRGLPAVLCVATLAVPYALALAWAYHVSGSRPAYDWIIVTDGTTSLALHALAGLGVAAASLVRGRRWSGGTWGSVRAGVPVACVMLLPAWGMLASRTAEWCLPPSLERGLEHLQPHLCSITRDGRTLFASLERRPGFPYHTVAIDLGNGALRKVFPPDSWVGDWQYNLHAFAPAAQYPVRLGRFALQLSRYRDGSSTLLDTETLTEVAQLGQAPLGTEPRDALRAELADSSELRLADGRRGWVLEDRFEVREPDGTIHEAPWNRSWRLSAPLGHAFAVHRDLGKTMDSGIYDLQRERVFWLGKRTSYTTALGDLWLERTRPSADAETWHLVDPDTGQRTILPAVQGHSTILAVLEDGRLLVRTRASAYGAIRFAIVDVRDGRFDWTTIPCPRDVVQVDPPYSVTGSPPVVRNPEEAVILSNAGYVAACFPYQQRFGPVIPGVWLGVLSAHDVLLRRGATLLRCDLRTGECTPLLLHE